LYIIDNDEKKAHEVYLPGYGKWEDENGKLIDDKDPIKDNPVKSVSLKLDAASIDNANVVVL
jgi:U3 small nucleolar RNA-associated protein 14